MKKTHKKSILCIVLLGLLFTTVDIHAIVEVRAFADSNLLKKEAASDVKLIFQKTSENPALAKIRVYRGASTSGTPLKKTEGFRLLKNAKEGDLFTYSIKANGCYQSITTEVITKQDLLAGEKTIEYTLESRVGTGYEASQVRSWSRAIEDRLFNVKNLKDIDRKILDTPAFSKSKGPHQFTTIPEGIAYLKKLCKTRKNSYLFFPLKDKDCPVVIFTQTRLTGIISLEKALQKLSANKKMKVMYQAQIHGNEPASGEGALTVCKRLSSDTKLVSAMDVVVIPYVNATGSKSFTRNDKYGTNLNRDSLRLKSQVTATLHKIYCQLMPEVFIDGHEFMKRKENGNSSCLSDLDDIRITCLENRNRGKDIFPLEKKIVQNTVNSLQTKRFRSFFYPPSWNSTTSCNYARLQNSLTFLVESYGIGIGKHHFERRVLSQYEAVTSILSQTAAQTDTIKRKVSSARKTLIASGKTYSTGDRFVLTHKALQSKGMKAVRPSFNFFGNIEGDRNQIDVSYNHAKILKSRSRPTAYLISKAAPGAKSAKNILKANGVRYFEIPPGSRVSVNQYSGTATKALIRKKKKITFTKGAYVFYMDQPAANIISASLEPDVGDTSREKGSFVQAGILKKKGKYYPIYRYTGKNPQNALKQKAKK